MFPVTIRACYSHLHLTSGAFKFGNLVIIYHHIISVCTCKGDQLCIFRKDRLCTSNLYIFISRHNLGFIF